MKGIDDVQRKFFNIYSSENESVSRMLSLHPIHMAPNENGNLPPSALVPFCSYQGNFLGQNRPELGNVTMCDIFKPIILEGQLCYSLDSAKLRANHTKSGRSNGLFLLVDPDPYKPLIGTNEEGVDIETTKQVSFTVHIHSLAAFTANGAGSFAISNLKKMTGTESFEKLSDAQKKCQVHSRQECQNLKYLEQVVGNCGCLPWVLGDQVRTDLQLPTNEFSRRCLLVDL